MDNRKKIYYLASYRYVDQFQKREASLAATLQEEYFAQVLNDLGYRVELVAHNGTWQSNGIFKFQKGFVLKNTEDFSVRFFSSVDSKIRLLKKIGQLFSELSFLFYLSRIKNEIIIIYHSVGFYRSYRLLKRVKAKYILEVEEIYADVTQDKDERTLELRSTKGASAYIIPNRLMAGEVAGKEPWILYHGSCKKEVKMQSIFHDGRRHIVYAGTLEPEKIEDMPSLDMIRYLDENYHIHILGLDSKGNLERIKKRVSAITDARSEITFHNPFYGEDYLSFIQSCDIGIYPQSSDGIDIYTSFPSKIMSYLSNGLRVVATRTEPLVHSEVADLLFFADTNSGEDFAKAIREIDFDEEYDSRGRLDEIEEKLKRDLVGLVTDIYGV